MATLQQTPISYRSKVPPPTSAALTTPRTLSFSYYGGAVKFPSLSRRLFAATSRRGSSAGARMAATAAASYAVALAGVAQSNDALEAMSGDMEKVDKIFADPTVLEFFSNPTIEEEKKKEVVDELASSSSLQPYTVNFLKILVDAKRIDLINDIVKEFEAVYNTLTETELAVVSSVVQLESQHLAQIAKQVQKLTGAKNVRIKTVIDPSLVAGFTVRFGKTGSKLIDLSVKKQLEEIAAQLDLGDIKLSI